MYQFLTADPVEPVFDYGIVIRKSDGSGILDSYLQTKCHQNSSRIDNQMTTEFICNSSSKISIRIPDGNARLITDILIRKLDDRGILQEF